MSIRITVKSTDLRARTKKGTEEVFAFEQIAWAHCFDRNGTPDPYPTKVTLTIWVRDGKREHEAYPLGEYTLDPRSFTIGDYGSLQCSPRLVAVQTAAKV